MERSDLLKKALNLPEKPGVYTYYDKNGKVIYVGKAKNLKNRVTTYFQSGRNAKTEKLMKTAANFEIIVTETELQALLTECSLIKQHNPFFNIKLKDSKGYPYIRVKETAAGPSVEISHTRKPDGGKLFGPYAFRHHATLLCELLKRTFRLADCASKKIVPKKVCLEYHIGRCSGFCENKVPDRRIDEIYSEICSILDGRTDEICEKTKKEMLEAADRLDFETAAILRDKAEALETVKKRQKPLVVRNTNADYIACVESEEVGVSLDEPVYCVFMLRIRNGYIVGERCDIFEISVAENTDALMSDYISRYYAETEDMPKYIYCSLPFTDMPLLNDWLGGKIKTARLEQDKAILETAKKNCRERILQHAGKAYKAERDLSSFREFTGISSADNMEVYDISHIAGENVVCGMIACVNGKTEKSRYKRFKIEKRYGNDDTAYMKEAVRRRLSRYFEGDKNFSPLPDVIICDGGLGQIHAVSAVVREFNAPITVIGLKKDSRHRTKSVVFGDGRELLLEKNHDVFAFCGNLQEEVHRYAIAYHKKLRDEQEKRSELYEIDGVGKTRAKNLFLHFRSFEKIKNATVAELAEVKGVSPALAEKIYEYFEDKR